MKEMKLFPRINSANGQVNFQLKKSILPKELKKKLPSLKSVKIKFDDFEF